MIYPSTATLTGPSGFGDGFGEAFGGWTSAVTATLTPTSPGTAELPAPATFGSSPFGASAFGGHHTVATAEVEEAPVLAEIRLV